MQKLTLCAPCLFGLESVLAHEVRRIGGESVETIDGRVVFQGDLSVAVRANLWLRTAERVGIVLGSFPAQSFTELFDGVQSLPFEQFIGSKDAFPVKGWSLKSALHSIPDCQSIIKKAAVKRLEKAYGQSWFEETGPVHQIRFSIHKDQVMIMLDSSGEGLHKRGYRKISALAPIKETLAAGMADLARIGPDDLVADPMCGSGTLLIESALRAFGVAPGLRRKFAGEQWGAIESRLWKDERERALGEIRRDAAFRGIGFDSDPAAVALSLENSKKAGVGKKIEVAAQDIGEFSLGGKKGIVLCNPPYGERMLELKQAEELYRRMGRAMPGGQGISYYIISPHEHFEELFGRRADKRRKLYNGMIKCQLFMYFR